MIRKLISITFLVFICCCLCLTSTVAQETTVPRGWKKVVACNISLYIPNSLRHQNSKGVDSCIAVFSGNSMDLSIDYGMYGGPYKKYNDSLNFKEETISIAGYKALFVTFDYDSKFAKPSRRFIAGVYIDLDASRGEEQSGPLKLSLNMKVAGKSRKSQVIAKQIFLSIMFEQSRSNNVALTRDQFRR